MRIAIIPLVIVLALAATMPSRQQLVLLPSGNLPAVNVP